ADTTVMVAMDDMHRLGVAVEHVHERAFVVQLFHGTVHAIQPGAHVLCAGFGENDVAEQQAENPAEGPAARLHCAPRSSGCCRSGDTVASIAAASRAAGVTSAPTTFECTEVRLNRDAYSPWCMR